MSALLSLFGMLLAVVGLGQVLGILVASLIRRRWLRGVAQGVALLLGGLLIGTGVVGLFFVASVVVAHRLGRRAGAEYHRRSWRWDSAGVR